MLRPTLHTQTRRDTNLSLRAHPRAARPTETDVDSIVAFFSSRLDADEGFDDAEVGWLSDLLRPLSLSANDAGVLVEALTWSVDDKERLTAACLLSGLVDYGTFSRRNLWGVATADRCGSRV